MSATDRNDQLGRLPEPRLWYDAETQRCSVMVPLRPTYEPLWDRTDMLAAVAAERERCAAWVDARCEAFVADQMEWTSVPVTPTSEMLERAIYAQQPNQPLGGSGNANRLRRRAARIWAAMLEGAEHERRTQQERQDRATEGAAGQGGAQSGRAKAAAATEAQS